MSTEELRKIWDEIVKGTGIDGERISLWLAACEPAEINSRGELVIDAPNAFVKNYIDQNFIAELNKAGKAANIKSVALRAADADAPKAKGNKLKRSNKGDQDLTGDLFSVGNIKKVISLNPNYTFASFVVGKSNRLAHAASLAVAEMPGKAYNPLFIWGGVGLGKTHLMHAICHYALERNPELKVLYISAENFLNEFVHSIAFSKTRQFKERYRNLDFLLIDDIQFLGNKEQSQEEFFHTFNTLHDGNKQVVICSDRRPSELNNIEDRLISRFAGGLVTDVQNPDLETRVAILQRKATLKGRVLPDDVIYFLANNMQGNIRELEGALNLMIACSDNFNEPPTVDLVSKWLRDMLDMAAADGLVTIDLIKRAVAARFNFSPSELASVGRTAELAQARQIAMYLSRELTDSSLNNIAKAFGKKDHTTVLHAQRKIAELINSNPEFNKMIESIKRSIINN
ncbi:MAG: chromosomal replication initiator protein DnaA [Synergistaceae bacterium]|nr:chromosomal replication initiator protein DnaA [Synergistaceae bacterium]